ncbi:MAG: ABC transporter ATP-binding protein [Planctomycetes bacterium]|nr:ABC transporter ATP-binding protein [Planctomycetota bacterium]
MSLVLKDVRKSYREPDGRALPVLNIAEFTVQSGEQVALLGPSGGGKTTLLNVISGITLPDSGAVLIDNIDLARLHEVRRDRFRAQKIGFVFQTFNLLQAFSALENVLLGMSFSGKPVDRKRALELLDQVGLSHRLHHKPSRLSVGEQQRVAVARALANKPSLLLADEPTANVDVKNQNTILDLICTACHENQVSLLMVTHSLEVAGRFQRVDRLTDFNRTEAVA